VDCRDGELAGKERVAWDDWGDRNTCFGDAVIVEVDVFCEEFVGRAGVVGVGLPAFEHFLGAEV
jgi:hypothetical protein